MLAIRYVTLAALVVWLGGLVTLGLLIVPSAEELRRVQSVGFFCGTIIFVCLIVIKFVGPPPHDFFRRAGLVALMLAASAYAAFFPAAWNETMAIDIVLGFVLLFWYVRE